MSRFVPITLPVALLLAICTAMPTRRTLMGGNNNPASSTDLPATMLHAHVDSGAKKCVKPDFSCVMTQSTTLPTVLPGTALVRVNISSVNPSDVDIVEGAMGKYFGTLGADFSGVVVKVGALCSKLKVGDAVWGVTKGAYAEYALAVCHITGKLGDVDPRTVGTLPEVSLTSAQALKKTGAPWDASKKLTVVVTSGSGGTGFVALQLAKAYGAGKVITATSGADNIAFVKAMGADVVTDYKKGNIFSFLANNSVDIVYDNYGAPGTADKAMASLKPGGTFIFLPGKGGHLSKHPKAGVKQINYGLMMPSASLLDELLVLHKAGKLRAHVQRTYPLTNVSGAFAESAAGGVVGKLAIEAGTGQAAALVVSRPEAPLGNACNVTEKPWDLTLTACDCGDGPASPKCELEAAEQKKPPALKITCKATATTQCRAAVSAWAKAYRSCSNARDPKCYQQDPNFKGSQDAEKSCASAEQSCLPAGSQCDDGHGNPAKCGDCCSKESVPHSSGTGGQTYWFCK